MTKEKEQQQTPITIGSASDKDIACAECKQEGKSSEFYSYQTKKGEEDVYLCQPCREKINGALEEETKNPKMVRAMLLGAVAAAIGGFLWYLIVVITGIEFGYAAIGLGYIVGMGVYIGAGKKRGKSLQILAVLLTAIAIFVAEHNVLTYFFNEYVQANPAEFPEFGPDDWATLYWFTPEVLSMMVSPMGLIIYGIGLYVAYGVPKPQKV